ncbi:MAG: ATP-binding protein, partial [Sedimentisphaerales bacterium]|nr:ATP-binding protein [Sedimentisphaerales bacterium]
MNILAIFAKYVQITLFIWVEIAMLVEFRVKNYRSIKDEQVLSLVATTDDTLKDNCIDVGKLPLLKAAGIYGPNASGKSNLIRAMRTMQQMILNSAGAKPGSGTSAEPFLFDDKSQKEPTSFEIIFYHNKIRYQYGFTATKERIHNEWLFASPKKSNQKWFERSFDKKTGKTDWKFGSYYKGEKIKLTDKTRDNALFLSVAAQWNHEQLTTLYEWFKDNLMIISPYSPLEPITARMLLDKTNAFELVISAIMKEADFGISGLHAKPVDVRDINFPDDLTKDEREHIAKLLEEKNGPPVEILHQSEKSRQNIYLPLEEESHGTQRFFQLVGPWLISIKIGFTLLVDELEASLHPLLTRELIKIFQNPDINKSGAQLVFTTHDTTLLDPELFRRDQIWFTEK